MSEENSERPARRTARLSVGYREARGEEVVHIFGARSRQQSEQWGPATWAVWNRVLAEARASGPIDFDLDEFDAAQRADDEARRSTT